MAHFAQIDENNIVTKVIVVADEHEADGENWCTNFIGGNWKQTSYNTVGGVHALGGTPFRKNFAGIGYRYDSGRDAFIPPSNFPSWTLNETTCQWECPTAHPDDGEKYTWIEATKSWELTSGLTMPINYP
jgi:hypothetical protein